MEARIIRRPDALERGTTDTEIQRACRTGRWARLRRGAYMAGSEYDALDEYARHRVLAESVLRATTSDAVLSHVSAAVLHGLQLWNTPLDVVHLTRNRSHGGRKSNGRKVHASPYEPDEVTEVDGLRVTELKRTVPDLARLLSFEQAVVVGDYALRTTSLTSAEVIEVLNRVPNHPRYRWARRAVDFMDGHSESVGESRSRALFIRELLPIPESQVDVYDESGTHLGRVDFLLKELGVVGEFDGRIKYGRLVPEGQLPEDVLWAEKQREDRLRDAGWQVVRWIWDELRTPAVVVKRINDALARAKCSPSPRGHTISTPKP